MGVCYNDTKSKRLKREKMLKILLQKEIIKVNFGKFETSFENITKIFSYLPEIEKMIMIIYNKNIQNLLNINISDYKRISGRYKVLEKNGTGKEYILGTDELLFEGEYLNGKRNGKGKEYNKYGQLIFEGEYLNGMKKAGKGFDYGHYLTLEIEKDGKGKEYHFTRKIKFEGEYKDGKRWNGKGYNEKGELEFEIIEGKGFAKEYYYEGRLRFEGEYLNGERKKGKEYDLLGNLKFEGEYFSHERRKGRIYSTGNYLTYEGELLREKKMEKEKNIVFVELYYMKENF